MTVLEVLNSLQLDALGRELHRFAADLYPVCRSITGEGIRKTLGMIDDRVPLSMFEIPTGTAVFDWEVPKEWNIRDAYITNSAGKRVVDFRQSNLHVVNYSAPIHATMGLAELRPHLFTIPEQPDWIPYRTSYYREDWGFCLSHNQLLAMKDEQYEVHIDSSLTQGRLTYGECYLPGETTDEVLISVHACHPSLANDNLSGIVVATFLAELLSRVERRYSYRFLFIPGTIGAIAWLAGNAERTERIRHGLVLTCLGDAGSFHYKKSRQGNAEIDRIIDLILRKECEAASVLEFSPYGYDERQYCSPGFNLPVGCLMRSIWGTFPEYHTSADNLEFIRAEKLAESLRVCASIVNALEQNRRYRSLNPYCEPQLGRRGLYSSIGGKTIDAEINARLWVLNFSDGMHSLLDIAERSGLTFPMVQEAAALLHRNGLLSLVPDAEGTASAESESAELTRVRPPSISRF